MGIAWTEPKPTRQELADRIDVLGVKLDLLLAENAAPPPPVEREDRWTSEDETNRCPRCKSRHAVSLYLIRTDVKRDGELVSLKTGNRMRCERCLHEYASTDEGVFEYPSQPVYPANVTSTETKGFDGPPPVKHLNPRERKASV